MSGAGLRRPRTCELYFACQCTSSGVFYSSRSSLCLVAMVKIYPANLVIMRLLNIATVLSNEHDEGQTWLGLLAADRTKEDLCTLLYHGIDHDGTLSLP